jgi:hypothetical protein
LQQQQQQQQQQQGHKLSYGRSQFGLRTERIMNTTHMA